ncbi:MAG: hypothetical protein ACRCXZ_04785 [Patescibacteria group bacterium]
MNSKQYLESIIQQELSQGKLWPRDQVLQSVVFGLSNSNVGESVYSDIRSKYEDMNVDGVQFAGYCRNILARQL